MGLLPNVAASFQRTAPEASTLISAYALGAVVGAPAITVLCAHAPRRVMLIALMMVYAFGNIMTIATHDFDLVVAFRFISGLPHGAFFGLAALVAASMARPKERARSIGRIMLGLTIATIVGVPLSSWCSQFLGWGTAFGAVGVIAVCTSLLLSFLLPKTPAAIDSSPMAELSGLKNLQIWLTLATGAVGFGGLFAVYTYLVPALQGAAHAPPLFVTMSLSVLGVGLLAGNTFGAGMIDRMPRRTTAALLLWDAAAAGSLVFTIYNEWAALLSILCVGFGIALAPALQSRLMEFAASAQYLAASLNHSAFNIANALGAWLAGQAISSGWGWGSPGVVGAMLALGGLAIFLFSVALEGTVPEIDI